MDTKKKVGIGAGAAALVTAVAGLVTAVFGSHSTDTAVTRNDTPIVINRPHDSSGSPLPVTVVTQKSGPPIVIVGHGAPTACATPTSTPSPVQTPTPSPTETPDC